MRPSGLSAEQGEASSSSPAPSAPPSAPISTQGSAISLLAGAQGECAAAAPQAGSRLPNATLMDAFVALHDELSSPHLRKEKNIQDFVSACASAAAGVTNKPSVSPSSPRHPFLFTSFSLSISRLSSQPPPSLTP